MVPHGAHPERVLAFRTVRVGGAPPFPKEATPAERLVFGAAQKLNRLVKEKSYKLLLCGIGVSNLASWISYYDLKREGYPLELVAEIGFYGYSPLPADPFIFNLRNLPTCRMISDIFTTLGIMMSGSQTWSVGVIGAGQVDRFGNVNTTKVSEQGPYLVGSGGANDVASGASEIIVTWNEQNPLPGWGALHHFPGRESDDRCLSVGHFREGFGKQELRLTGYFPYGSGRSEEEAVRDVREQCGWDLKVASPLEVLPLPSPEQLSFIRVFDPKRLFLGGAEAKR